MNIRIESWNGHEIRFVEKEPCEWWAIAGACGYSKLNETLEVGEYIIDRLNTPTSGFLLTSNGQLLYETDFYGNNDVILIPNVIVRLSEYICIMPPAFVDAINILIDEICSRRTLWFMKKADPHDCGELIKRLSELSRYDRWLLKACTRKISIKSSEAKIKRKLEPMVYFIQAENGLIKIGCTIDINGRYRALSAMSPCKLKIINTIRTDEPYKKELMGNGFSLIMPI